MIAAKNGPDFFRVDNYLTDGSQRPVFLGAIQPRIGASHDMRGDQQTVLFAGGGRYYDRTLFNTGVDERLRLQYGVRRFLFSRDGRDARWSSTIAWDPAYLEPDGAAAADRSGRRAGAGDLPARERHEAAAHRSDQRRRAAGGGPVQRRGDVQPHPQRERRRVLPGEPRDHWAIGRSRRCRAGSATCWSRPTTSSPGSRGSTSPPRSRTPRPRSGASPRRTRCRGRRSGGDDFNFDFPTIKDTPLTPTRTRTSGSGSCSPGSWAPPGGVEVSTLMTFGPGCRTTSPTPRRATAPTSSSAAARVGRTRSSIQADRSAARQELQVSPKQLHVGLRRGRSTCSTGYHYPADYNGDIPPDDADPTRTSASRGRSSGRPAAWVEAESRMASRRGAARRCPAAWAGRALALAAMLALGAPARAAGRTRPGPAGRRARRRCRRTTRRCSMILSAHVHFFWRTTDLKTGLAPDRYPDAVVLEHRGGRLRAHRVPDRRRARLRHARGGARSRARHAAVLPRRAAGRGRAGRHRVQGLLLPLPRHEDRASPRRGSSCRPVDPRCSSPGCCSAASTSRASIRPRRSCARIADGLLERVDWKWMAGPARRRSRWAGAPRVGVPRPTAWIGYNEAMIVSLLALGSPTLPVEPAAWDAVVVALRRHVGHGPRQEPPGLRPAVRPHQYSHVWVDFRGSATR